ncbi:MAG: hypothetical protein AB7F22_07895 [Reyranella sp.]|uniref:hypothetical protein n=1 Tax=Reyranella sp. TaxID=1929291 RepID=UPI003D0E26D6
MVRALVLLAPLALAGCASWSGFCDVQEPYTPPAGEARVVATLPYTGPYLVGTNLKGEAICHWTPPAR